jgi:hypothetical protein
VKEILRFALSFGLVSICAACVQVTTTPDVTVAIPTAGGAQWSMYLSSTRGVSTSSADVQLSFYIDHQLVGTVTGTDVIKIDGTHAGHPVQALCSVNNRGSCYIYVDGAQVATLPVS